jgi:DNA-binding XRE family transcriptional regulator
MRILTVENHYPHLQTNHPMDSIQEIREAFGLSQWQLAQWLGITRSILSMAELGHRSLPTIAYEKLNAMLQLLHEMDEPSTADKMPSKKTKHSGKVKRQLAKQASKQHLQAQQQQKKLEKLLQKKMQPQRMLAFVERMRNNPPTTMKPGEKVVLDMLEADAVARLDQKQESQIATLQLRIANLLSGAENASRLAAEWDENP